MRKNRKSLALLLSILVGPVLAPMAMAQGTPAEVRSRGGAEAGRTPTMEDAFIAIVDAARHRTPHLTAGSA